MGDKTVQTIAKESLKSDPTIAETRKFAVQHYTVAEIASLWKLSEDTIRRLFEKESDVPVIGNQKPRFGKRRPLTLRIPEFVVDEFNLKTCILAGLLHSLQ